MLMRRRLLLAAGCSLPFLRAARAQNAAPIRLGVVLPMSGVQQDNGEAIYAGAEIAADYLNKGGGILGRKVELVLRDDEAKPNTAVGRMREMLGMDINLYLAGVYTAPLQAMLPPVQQANAVVISPTTITLSLTHENFTRNLFRGGPNAAQNYRGHALAMAKKMPEVTKWAMVIPDVAFGHDVANAFADGLEDYYPKYAGRAASMLPPFVAKFDQNDYKQIITQILATDAQGVFSAATGASAITLYSQGRQFGWEKQIKVIGDVGLELGIGNAMGHQTPSNIWSNSTWYYDAPGANTLSHMLADEYRKSHKALPRGFVERGFTSILALANGVRAAGSTDSNAVIAAMEAEEFETVTGPYRFRKEDHQALAGINYIRLDPDLAEPGWKVTDFVTAPGAEVAEPASPGAPFKFRHSF